METQPDIENVSYIDEYPELAERIRLRRLAEVGKKAVGCTIIYLPRTPQGRA